LIETISPSTSHYHLDLIIIIKLFFQCEQLPLNSSLRARLCRPYESLYKSPMGVRILQALSKKLAVPFI